MPAKQTIPVAQAQPGQVLAEHALKGGAIIVPKGTSLTAEVLGQLHTWHVADITVFAAESTSAAPITALTIDQAVDGQVLAEPVLKNGAVIVPAGTAISPAVRATLDQWHLYAVTVYGEAPAAAPEPEPVPPAGTVTAADGVPRVPHTAYHTVDPRTLLTDEERTRSQAAAASAAEQAGELVITGNVGLGHGDIDTPLPVRIEGSVLGGISIHSPVAVTVSGELFGARVSCNGAVNAKTIRRAVVLSGGIVTAETVTDAVVEAGEQIAALAGNGIIAGGLLLAGGEIIAKRLGTFDRKPTELVIRGNVGKLRYQRLLDVEAAVAVLQKEVAQLQKVIDLIRMLGQQVASLPPEKKQQLKQQSDLFFARQRALEEKQRDREQLEQALAYATSGDYCPVRAYEIAYAGVRLHIEGSEFVTEKINNNIGFHKKATVLIRLFR